MRLSVVVPCHNEQDNVPALAEALCGAIPSGIDHEIIFVNDGSTDETLARIRALREKDHRIKYISLMTNYGHQNALMAGLRAASGDIAITLDADHQHPPSMIPEFLSVQRKTGVPIVSGRRINSQQGWSKRVCSSCYYVLFRWLTGLAAEPGASDFRLYTRTAIDQITSVREMHPFFRALIANLRLKQAYVDYSLAPRHAGTPAYTFRKSLHLGMLGLLRFSNAPFRVGILTAVLGILFSAGQATHYIYVRFFTDKFVSGQTDIMVFLAFIGSALLLLLSLTLRYVREILDLLRGHAPYVIAEQELDG